MDTPERIEIDLRNPDNHWIYLNTTRWRDNGTEGCGWMYGEIAREWDYKNAEKLIPQLKEVTTVEQLNNIADVLRPWTKEPQWLS